MTDTRYQEFRSKLEELLKEYNASIDFTCSPCSDTHGIHDDAISISLNNVEIERFPYCWGIDSYSFKQ